jgi:uncharacterized membrane protein
MSYLLMLLGAAMIFFGIKSKVSKHTINELANQNAGETMKAGCRGYLKVMLIALGIVLILIGLLLQVEFN